MIERHIQAVRIEDPGAEEPAATRERLRDLFPRGATRRMTQLGILVGAVLEPLAPAEQDTLVYATSYGESRALQEYLASFPNPSPTLFQTSIHPSAVQQYAVARRRPIREFFPLAGRRQVVAHAARAALLSPAARSILCGGEERNPWLEGSDAASPRTFAFALALVSASPGSLGRLRLQPGPDEPGELALPEFFEALRDRRPIERLAAQGCLLTLSWR